MSFLSRPSRLGCVCLLVLAVTTLCPADDDLPALVAEKGSLIFSDDFERSDLGDWKSIIPTFTVQDGVLKGEQTRADHGAVGRIHHEMKDVVMEFRFRLVGSDRFNVVFDDKNHKGSHAGHICRVALNPQQIRLGDDREGIMRNDIFAMRRDPAKKKSADKWLVGREASANFRLNQQQWYQAKIEINDDQMRVNVDGKPIATLRSPGIAHETKLSVHFTVNGPGVLFDDVKIWSAK